MDGFAGHVVLSFRADTQHRLRVVPLEALDSDGFVIEPAFDCGMVAIGPNTDYDADGVTVEDQSYVEPPVWSDVDLRTGERTERLRREAPGHDASSYVCERRDLPAPTDPVPATLVRHRDTPLDGSAPALLYGYGAYESVYRTRMGPRIPRCWTAVWSSRTPTSAAVARAGAAGGWTGGCQHKQHTFDDYAAVADGLAAGSSMVTGSPAAG